MVRTTKNLFPRIILIKGIMVVFGIIQKKESRLSNRIILQIEAKPSGKSMSVLLVPLEDL